MDWKQREEEEEENRAPKRRIQSIGLSEHDELIKKQMPRKFVTSTSICITASSGQTKQTNNYDDSSVQTEKHEEWHVGRHSFVIGRKHQIAEHVIL